MLTVKKKMKSFSFQEVDGGELTGDNATKLGKLQV